MKNAGSLKRMLDYGAVYRSFLQRAEHCISKKPLNKDYLYRSVLQAAAGWTLLKRKLI